MAQAGTQVTSTLLEAREAEVLQQWMLRLKEDGALHSGRIREAELQTQCGQFLRLLRDALAGGGTDIESSAFAPLRDLLADI